MVLGFEHGAEPEGGSATLGKTYNMKKETAEKRGRFWWSSEHIESFNAAVVELGGVRAAKGTAVLQKTARRQIHACAHASVGECAPGECAHQSKEMSREI
jgi:hypothetical protein